MADNEWHVRPSFRVRVWEVWRGQRLVADGTLDAVWERAKTEAQLAKGQAYLHYKLRTGIREFLDFRAR